MEINKIYQGDALSVLRGFPSESVDCVITSPPYWMLRDYGIEPIIWDGDPNCKHQWVRQEQFCQLCGAWKGCLGLEPDFNLYLNHLWKIFDEVRRVLKKSGTCFINLGDCYSRQGTKMKYPPKSLCLIPYRFAIGMVERGWLLRNIIIWYKSNALPESVKDRWVINFEPIFFFVKNKRYWYEQQFESYKRLWDESNGGSFAHPVPVKEHGKTGYAHSGKYPLPNPFGRGMRSVWMIPTASFPDAHFATFPPNLIKPMLKAGCPKFICKKCGKPREKIYKRISISNFVFNNDKYQSKIKYTDCGCNAGWQPGIVLDPFMGAGTTALVAQELGYNWIGIELKKEYIEMAYRRLKNLNNSLLNKL